MLSAKLVKKQKKEAVKRLNALGVLMGIILDVEKGVIYYSESVEEQFPAVLNVVENREDIKKFVTEFEEENDALVYHVILNHMKDGNERWTLLFVSEDEDDWEVENDDIKCGMPIAYEWCNGAKKFVLAVIKPSMGRIERIE